MKTKKMLMLAGIANFVVGFIPPIDGFSIMNWTVAAFCLAIIIFGED